MKASSDVSGPRCALFNLIEATSNVCATVAAVTAAMAATVSVRLALRVVVAADMTRLTGRKLPRSANAGARRGLARAERAAEGLASYTGTVLAAPSPAEAIASALDQLAAAETQESFVRTFAYASGPAYGLLLDASSPGWRQRVRGTDDLAALVMRALAVQPANNVAAIATRYGGAELRASEQQREQQRQERFAELRRRFVDGPVLLLPGRGAGSFDARGAVTIPGVGTVYFGAYRFSGDWGTLEAEKGVLVQSDGAFRRVSVPVRRDEASVAGDGWIFKASPGWVVREGTRPGDYEVVRRQP